jgi:cell division septation protein DedD
MKKDEDNGSETPDLSSAQLYIIAVSIIVIIVLSFAVMHFLKKEPSVESHPAPSIALPPPPVEAPKATKLPEGGSKEELATLEKALPKQVQEQKKEEPKPPAKVEVKEEKKEAKPLSPPAPPIVNKNIPAVTEKVAPAQEEIKHKVKEKTVHKKAEKPKVKTVGVIHRAKAVPLNKETDVHSQKVKVAVKHKAGKEAKKAPLRKHDEEAAPAPVEKVETLAKKPGANSFVSEPVKPPPAPYVPVEAPPVAVITSPPPAPSAESGVAKPSFTVIVRTFPSESDAKDYTAQLSKKGYKSFFKKRETPKSTWYDVMVGEFADKETADKSAATISQNEGVKARVRPFLTE